MRGKAANPGFFNQKPNEDFGITVVAPKGPPPKQQSNNQSNQPVPEDQGISGKSLEAAIKKAKQTGTLSLQGRSLKVFPQAILNFQELQMEGNWWESFDLQKIDISNNQIALIPEEIAAQSVSSFSTSVTFC